MPVQTFAAVAAFDRAAPFPSLRSGLPPQAGEDKALASSPARGGSVRRSLTKGAP